MLDHRTETAYDGRTYTDLSAQAGAVKVLKSGTILVTFRTTSRAQAMTLLSASDPTHTASNITLSVSAGALQFSARDKGVLQDNHLTRTMYDDGEWHTAAVTVSGGTTTFYADGRPVHSVASGTFFSKVSGLTSLNIARNVDSDHPGGEWFFTGGIRRVAVYQHALTKQQVAEQSVRVDLADFGRIATILNSDTPATWVVTGDSITHGALWTNGWRSYVEHFQERVRWELGKPKNSDFVLDTGVSGSTTNDLTAKFAERVAAFSPRVVSVMLGTNDVATPGIGVAVYRANLLKLIASIRVLPGQADPAAADAQPDQHRHLARARGSRRLRPDHAGRREGAGRRTRRPLRPVDGRLRQHPASQSAWGRAAPERTGPLVDGPHHDQGAADIRPHEPCRQIDHSLTDPATMGRPSGGGRPGPRPTGGVARGKTRTTAPVPADSLS